MHRQAGHNIFAHSRKASTPSSEVFACEDLHVFTDQRKNRCLRHLLLVKYYILPVLVHVNMFFFLLFSFQLFFTGSACGHETAVPQEVGIEEKVGQALPLDAVFYDEQGAEVTLRQLIDRPVVLSLVYYNCDRICPQFLGALAEVLGKLPPGPGKNYTVLTVSFDPDDTPQNAREARKNYIKALDGKFPENSWKFLTGNKAATKKLTDAVGFKIQREELHGFSHPLALIVLSPDGRITRYLYTTNYAYGAPNRIAFLPFDLSMAIADASRGKTGVSNRRDSLYCFPHAPEEQEAFFNLLKIMGAVIMLSIIGFFIYLTSCSGKARKDNGAGK